MKFSASLYSLLCALLCTGFFSCSEEFEVAAPYKNITVVYSFLNHSDTAQYFRIQKAYLDENRSAFDIARLYDSNFYASLEVRVKEMSGQTVVSNTILQKVDLASEGFAKDTGVFFNSPNFGYKYLRPLNASYRYRLIVTNTASGEVDSGETLILDTADAKFRVPRFTSQDFLSNGLSFPDPSFNTVPLKTFNLDFIETPPGTGYIEGTIRFRWIDSNIQTAVRTPRFGDWVFAQQPVTKQFIDLSVPQAAFYGRIRDIMGLPANNTVRLLDSADFTIWVSTVDYNAYRNYAAAQGGLTGDQIRPNYTNLKGEDVLGLFTSRARKQVFNIPIDEPSLNELKINAVTRDLKITGRSRS